MVDIFFTSADIEEWTTIEKMKEDYNITFISNGWYQIKDNDYALVIERHNHYKLWLWIDLDPRDEIEKILDLPLH